MKSSFSVTLRLLYFYHATSEISGDERLKWNTSYRGKLKTIANLLKVDSGRAKFPRHGGRHDFLVQFSEP